MKYSQLIGVLSAFLLIIICFFPWAYIPSIQLTISGMHAEGTNFGKPGLFNCILSGLCIILFCIPAIWAKRTNVFLAALNMAWAARNFLMVSTCLMGECPEKKIALYLMLLL